MTTHAILMCVPMFVLLTTAAVTDWRSRRIPNWLTFSLAASGLVQSLLPGSTLGLLGSLAGLGVGLALPFVLFVLGAVRGGDVKLMAGIGAWLGMKGVLVVFLLEAVIGMIIVLVQAVMQGRMRKLMRNSTVVTMNMVHLGEIGVETAAESGQACRSVDRPLPYAVPVLLAVAVVVGVAWGSGGKL